MNMFKRVSPIKFAEMITNRTVERDVFYNVYGNDADGVNHDDLYFGEQQLNSGVAFDLLDADLIANNIEGVTTSKDGTLVMQGVIQENGKIIQIYPIEVEKAGAAANVVGLDTDTGDVNTVYGAKAYADSKIEAALSWEEVE